MAGKTSPALFELIRDPAVVRMPKGEGTAAPPEEAAKPEAPQAPTAQALSAAPPRPATVPAPPMARPPAISPPAPSGPAQPAAEPNLSLATPAAPAAPVHESPARSMPISPALRPTPEATSGSRRPEPASAASPPPPTYAGRAEDRRGKGQFHRSVNLSTSAICLIGAGVLVSWIILWQAAYSIGYNKADERASRELSLAAAPLSDPLLTEPTSRVGPIAAPAGTVEPQTRVSAPATRQPQAPTRTGSAQPQPIPSGIRAVMVPPEPDPRREGLNYYAIEGQLDRESAEQIVRFLAEHGVSSVAVDTSPPGANNLRSYRVYGLMGLTSAEYRTAARTDYEQRISRLGEVFRQDYRGWTDFSRTTWERHRP